MSGPRVTVDAPMFAAAIRIDAGFESNIRTVVVGDNPAGGVFEELRARRRILLGIPIGVTFKAQLLETVGRVAPGTAAGKRVVGHTAEG